MSENTTNRNVKDDEIDLLDLFRRMGRTFSRWGNLIGRGLLISFVFLIKKWLPLGISILLGIGASVLLRSTSSSSYSSDLVLRNNVTTTADMISYLNQLHNFSIGMNRQNLLDAISLTAKQAKDVIDINAYWIIDKGPDGNPDYVDYKNNHNVYDTINIRMQDRLDVRVRVRSIQELSVIQAGILKFIDKDSLFQQRNRIRLRQNVALLSRLNYDIMQLDSLQKIKYFEETKNRYPDKGGQMIFLQEQKTQLVYTDIYTLYEKKQALELEKDLYKGIVTVLSDFPLPSRRDNGGFFYARIVIPAFFLITLLVLIIIANIRKLEDIFNKY
jgi:hypothetical protein